MEKLTAIYALTGFALLVVGGAMILRKAFSVNLWWGLGCLLLPVITPVFVVLKWRDTRKAFLVFVIGAVMYGGIYLNARDKANQAVDEIKIVKITLTTGLNDTELPVSDLTTISIKEKRVLLFVRMQVPPKHLYQFKGQVYDESGKVVFDETSEGFPDREAWNTWFYHGFDELRDKPGRWRFVFFANDKQLAEQEFEVTNDDKKPSTNHNGKLKAD